MQLNDMERRACGSVQASRGCIFSAAAGRPAVQLAAGHRYAAELHDTAREMISEIGFPLSVRFANMHIASETAHRASAAALESSAYADHHLAERLHTDAAIMSANCGFPALGSIHFDLAAIEHRLTEPQPETK